MSLNSLLIIVSLALLCLSSCGSNETDKEYTFLLTCYEDFYLNYDIELVPVLDEFEEQLISEGHLDNSSGEAYRKLLLHLKENNYFDPPLKKDDFENALLYKNPENIANCAVSIFGLDSTDIAKTAYFKASRKIADRLSSDEEVPMNYIFDVYASTLSAEELEKPFVLQSIQVMLYRWYFKSKYDREIPFDQNN